MTTTKPRVVSVLGAGRLGRGVAAMLLSGGARVRMYARRALSLKQAEQDLPGLETTASLEEAVRASSFVFFAVPATALLEVAREYAPFAAGDHLVLHGCRGVGEGFLLPHQAIRQVTCVKRVGALGGPLYTEDFQSRRPLAAVVASRYDEVVEVTRALTEGTPVRVHASSDPVGVEVAGALSNVAMIAAGMSDALDLGETARGVLLTHGLSEAARLGVALGAAPGTFSGLAGVGDLIPRRVTSTLRNFHTGEQVAKGRSLDEVLEETVGAVEGITTAREAAALAERLSLELPLVRAVRDVLAGVRPAREALESVLTTDLVLGADAL